MADRNSISSRDAASAMSDGRTIESAYARIVGDVTCEQTWIVLSHVRIPEGSFAQSRVFGYLDGAKLFFNTPGNNWYSKGIPGIGNSLASIVSWLETALAGRDPDKVTFVGHSMGAHLAIALSQHFGAAGFVATSPELNTGLPGSRSQQNGVGPDHPWGDLYRLLPNRPRRDDNITIFGLYDGADAYYLGRESTYDGRFGEVYCAPYHHGVTEFLTANRYYLSILLNRRAYVDALVRQGHLLPAPDRAERARLWTFAAAQVAYSSGDQVRAARLCTRQDDWPNAGWQSLRADVFRSQGDRAAALHAGRSAVQQAPDIPEYPLQLARLAREFRDNEGLRIAEDAMRDHCPPHRAIERYFQDHQGQLAG